MLDTLPPIPLEGTVLTIEIENSRPIELIDLTESFLSLGEEYKRFLLRHPEFGDTSQVRLYIKKITSSNVKADLIALASVGSQLVMPVVSNSNSLIAFGKNLKWTFDYLTGRTNDKPELDKTAYTNVSEFVRPVAKDNASQVNVSVTINGGVQQTFNVNSADANVIQDRVLQEIGKLREPDHGIKSKVVLYWEKGAPHAKTGNRGIIESVWLSDVKVIFENDRVKEQMLLSAENPFRYGYIVDVGVETIGGKPVLYKIINYYDVVERPDDASPKELPSPQ